MTPPPPTPALARLRGQFPAAGAPRVLVHAGTCGMQAGSRQVLEALRAALPAATVEEAACDGACWAAPSATVQRDGHAHRFARLEKGVPAELAECLAGRCDDEYAGRGERGMLARLGRTDGSFEDAIVRGAYAAWARASTQRAEEVLAAIVTAARAAPGGPYASVVARWFSTEHLANAPLLVSARHQPGMFAVRHLVQGDPHRVIEGIAIACRALSTDRAIVAFGADDPLSHTTFEGALHAAEGILDGTLLGGGLVSIETRVGGRSAPATAAVSDTEALAALTLVHDAAPPPTRLLSLMGAFARPGLYEVPLDGASTWAGLIALAGTNPGRIPALLVGGPEGELVPGEDFEAPLTSPALADGAVLALPPGADLD